MLKKDLCIETIYTELPFEKRFAAAKADGFDAVEIWSWEDRDPERIRELLAENGMTLAAMSGDGPYSMCDPSAKKDYIDYIRRSIETAGRLGVHTLVIHSDALEDDPPYAKKLNGNYSDLAKSLAMFDVLREIAPLGEKAGIIFVLEALNIVKEHIGNFLQHTETSADFVRAAGSDSIRILYDAYHMYLNEGKICETAEKYLPYLGHIHIADAPGRHEPGTGVLNYRQFIKHLDRIGYEGYVGFELFPERDSATAVKAILDCFQDDIPVKT